MRCIKTDRALSTIICVFCFFVILRHMDRLFQFSLFCFVFVKYLALCSVCLFSRCFLLLLFCDIKYTSLTVPFRIPCFTLTIDSAPFALQCMPRRFMRNEICLCLDSIQPSDLASLGTSSTIFLQSKIRSQCFTLYVRKSETLLISFSSSNVLSNVSTHKLDLSLSPSVIAH